MDIQKMFDAFCDSARQDRSKYHITLGELIEKLKQSEKELPVVFSDGGAPGEGDSYRGYYSDFALERTEASTVEELQGYLEDEVLNKTFEGYKGGEYAMSEDAPLWVAPYGSCGPAIVGYADDGERVVLTTKDVD